MSHTQLTRFAPAPTGLLHIGHVVNAIHVWGLGAARGARVLLRVEDHDRQRSRAEFETSLLEDLDWLGFVPDLHPTIEFREGVCASRQSERGEVYASFANTLITRGLVYGCTCSRQQIADHHANAGSTPTAYPGTCRELGHALGSGVTWRVRIAPGIESFADVLCGEQHQDPSQLHGDMAIRDRHGNWTYSFAVVVDDWLQNIDFVIRGVDLLDATGGQMRLARLIGRTTPPLFAHHAVIMKSPRQKLSKADGDTGLRELRHAGWSAARVIGHAAALAGLAPMGSTVAASEVSTLFTSGYFDKRSE